MWKSNLLVSNFHTHPPGIRNHRFTKINKRTSNENHQRDPFQKSSNYIYIIHIYTSSPQKKATARCCMLTNKTFPLKKKKIPSTTKPPFFSNTQNSGFETPNSTSLETWGGAMHKVSMSLPGWITPNLLRRIVTQVARWQGGSDWRIITVTRTCQEVPLDGAPPYTKPWRKFGHLGRRTTRSLGDLLTMSIHHLLTGMILQVGIQCFKHTKNWYKDTRNGRFDFDLCLHSDLATRCWYVHQMFNT